MVKQSEKEKRKRRKVNVKSMQLNFSFLMMVLPGFALALVFNYLPLAGLCIAFKNIDYAKGILGSPWCGLKNFMFLFQSPDLPVILRNTLGYNIIGIILGVIVPVALAICFSQLRNKRFGKVYQTVMMLPYFVSWIIVTYIVYSFLAYNNGLLNHILTGLGKDPVDWYGNKKFWPPFLILLSLWKGMGYQTVVYIASIAGIDSSLYEAAAIDGANKRQQIIHIMLPELASIIIVLLIMAIGGVLNSSFELYYNVPMESGAILPVTNVISTYVYRALMLNADIGMSSAAGFFQSIVGFILIMVANGIVRKIDSEKAMF